FLRVNGALSRLTGYSETELLQLDDLAITHPSFVSESRSRLERLVAGAEVEFSVEKQYVRKDSSTFWGQVTVHAILDGNGPTRRATLVVQDISERKEAEQQRLLLMREVGHRSKNLLSVVQAIARQTARDSPPDRFIESFSRRLQGLSSSQDLLVAGDWKGVPLDELARSQLSHLGESRDVRLSISGTPLIVSASAAQAIGLALHELSTNALKYGSLSGLDGRVSVGWSLVDAAGGRRFVMSWTEVGGPPVTQPARRGFGSAVVERMASAALRGTASLVFLPDGVTWTLDAPAASVLEAAGDET
ncbi:MAG: HWE histidine kinase domain-containing protein, partial [Hyphomicrobiaceae bacterium]